ATLYGSDTGNNQSQERSWRKSGIPRTGSQTETGRTWQAKEGRCKITFAAQLLQSVERIRPLTAAKAELSAFGKMLNDFLPEPLLAAQKRGIEFFMGEECEWKLELKGSERLIEKIVGCPIYVFANNGFGDHLFLKRERDGVNFGEEIFQFLH